MRWNIRRHRDGDPRAMQRLYLLKDPWGLDVAEEEMRFVETARIIKERIGKHFGSLLEIGCGEGLQTRHLASLADRVIGVDTSPHAIKRAVTNKITNAHFEVADLKSYASRSQQRFDLVTACEVMYYFNNYDEPYQILSSLGKHCLVTYYQGMSDRLDPFFSTKPVESEVIDDRHPRWRVVWWKGSVV